MRGGTERHTPAGASGAETSTGGSPKTEKTEKPDPGGSQVSDGSETEDWQLDD